MQSRSRSRSSFALSLLLVFRTNSSYGRFDEARKLWGLLLNRSRDVVRQAVAFFPTDTWDAKATFARWVIIVSKALLCRLRADGSLRHEAGGVLGRAEMQPLLAAEHPVVLALQARAVHLGLALVHSCKFMLSAAIAP
jgi:ion channel-forming bestrophin family protein